MLIPGNACQTLINKERGNRPHREDASHTTVLFNAGKKGVTRSESQENVKLELQYNFCNGEGN